MKNAGFVITLIVGCLSVLGCGAMFQGSAQTVDIQSSPAGAKVTASPDIGEFTTPSSVSLSRKSSYTLTFTKDGYKPATAHIRASAKFGYILLDVLFTGLVGVVVDAATGSWNGLTPQNVVVALEKEDMGIIGPDKVQIRLTATDTGVKVESSGEPVRVLVERD